MDVCPTTGVHVTENYDTEWKLVWKSDYLRNIAAFANGDGGKLIIGVDDDGRVVGVDDPKQVAKSISDTVRNRLRIVPDVRIVEKGGVNIIEIDVEKRDFPIDLDGKYYRKSGNTTQEVSGNDLIHLILDARGMTWTDQVLTDSKAKAVTISDDTLQYIVRRGERCGRMSEDSKADFRYLTSHFGLLDDGKMTVAAALLLADDPSGVVPGAYVKIGKFTDDKFLMAEDYICAPVVKQADMVIDVLQKKYLKSRFYLEGITRMTQYEYPLDALREFVVNAVAHRDYSVFEPVEIRLYPRRIEIFNYAKLPRGWTEATLDDPDHGSVAPNRRIAVVLHEMGAIERWGSGIQKASGLCIDAGNGKPRFDTKFDGLRVTIDALDVGWGEAPETTLTIPNLTKGEERVLNVIRKDPGATVKTISEDLCVSPRTVLSNIKSLKNKNIIRREGSDRAGIWVVIKHYDDQ